MDNSCMQMWKASMKEAKCSSEKQGSSGENAERSYRPSGGERPRDGHHRDTDVMVERVSSTTEHSSLTVQNKQLRAKQINSKTPDKNHFKSKLNKSSQLPLGQDYKSHRKKHKEKQSASRKGKVLHPHTSKQHLPIEEKRIDSEVSSSFVVSTPSLRSTTPPIRPGSSARASTRFSSSDSEPSVKSHHGKDVYASQPLSEEIKRLIKQECSTAEEDQQGTGEQEHYKRHRETGGNEEIHNNEDKESNLYEKMVERKVREIRNNLERMSGKVSVSEEAVSESRHETRQKERQDSRKEDGEIYEHTNTELGHKRKRVRRKQRYEEEFTKPFVSAPCCSPPPRPANVTKYWSDADETEDESDNETHLQHTNSVNIVLNFLKNNLNKYYASGRKVSTKSTNMKAKTKFKSSIKGRLSYPPHLSSHQSRSKSDDGGVHPQAGNRRHWPVSPSEENHAGNRMRGHQPPARDHYGHSSRAHTPTMDEPSDHRDPRYKSPSGHRESYDGRRSLHLSDHRAAYYGRPPSPPHDPPESFPRSRGSCSPPWPRDHKYRSPSQRNRENSRDRRSGSPRHGVRSFRDSCSPLKHRESLHRDGRSPSHLRDAGDSSQYRKFIDENSRRNREFSPQSPERFSQERTVSYPMKRLLCPSYPDYPVPSHAKHTRGFESPRSGSPRGSAEPHTRVDKQELGGVGPQSRSHHEKNVTSKRQLSRQESENSLPLEFGKGAKKARKLSDSSTTERILVTFQNKEKQKKRGHISGSLDHSLRSVSPPGDTEDYQKGIQFEAERQRREGQNKPGHFSRSMDRSFSPLGDTDDYQKGIKFMSGEVQRQIREQQKKTGHFSRSMDRSFSSPGDTDDHRRGIKFEAQRQRNEGQNKPGHFSRSMDRSFSSPGDNDDYQKGINFMSGEVQRQIREQQKKTGHFSRSMDRSFSPLGDNDDYQKGIKFMSGEVQRQIREQQKKTGHFSRSIDHSFSPLGDNDDYQKGIKFMSGEVQRQIREQQKKTGHFSRSMDRSFSPLGDNDDYQKGIKFMSGEIQRQIREQQKKTGHFSRSIDHSLSPISPTGDTDHYQKGLQLESEQARGQRREQQKKPGHFSGSIDCSLSPISPPDDYQKGIKFVSGEARGQIREGHHVKGRSLGIKSGSSTLVAPDLAVPQTVIKLDVKLDDGEPIIEWPENYLNLSNMVSVYHRPSFVPDAQDRQKLDSLTKTCEAPRPVGITSMFSQGGVKKESLSHCLSDSEDDPKKVDVPTTVPQVCSPGTSLQAVSAEEATSNMLESSSTPEDTTQKAAGTEVNTIKAAAGTEVNTLKQAAGTEVNTIKAAAGTEVNTLKQAAGTEVNTIKAAAGTEVNTLKQAAGTEVNTIKAAAGTEVNTLKAAAGTEVNTLKAAAGTEVNTIKAAAGTEVNTIKAAAGTEVNTIKQAAGTEVNTTKEAAGTEVNTTKEAAGTEVNTTKEAAGTEVNTTKEAAGTEVNTTKEAAGTEVNTTKEAAGTEVNTTKEAAGTEVNTTKEAAGTEVNTTKEAAGTEVNTLKQAAGTEVNTTKEAAGTEEKALLNLNPAEMSTLMTLIKLAKEHVATGKELPTNLSQVVGSGDGPNLKTPEPQGHQSKDSQQQQPSKSQIIADQQKRAANEETIKATTNKSKNHSSDGGQSKEKDAVMNIKNYKIPKVKRDVDFNKKVDDNLSKSKSDGKPSQSKSKTDGSKKGEKNYEKSPGRNVDEKSQEKHKGKGHSSKDGGRNVDGKSHKKYKGKGHSGDEGRNVLETSQEKRKGKEQTSGDGGNVKETTSKKKMFRKDEASRQSKGSPKPLAMERTFAEMQSVKVDLSVSPEAVSSRGKRCPKGGKLKRVGGRIYMNDSSDSDSDDSKLPEADHRPKAVHPLHRETIVLDHSVNSCLACEYSLCPDEFTSISLNTGTVTMRCRNCCTYTRMEKVMSLDYRNAALSKPKNAASKATDKVDKVSHKKKDGKKRARSSSSHKGTDSEKSELDAMDPSLFVFPWTSSRNRKKVHEDLLLNDNSNSTDSDEFRRKLQQDKKPVNKRKSSSPKKRPHHVGSETSKHPSKPTSVDKPCISAKDNTMTESSDAVKISSHTEFADDTNPKAKVRKMDALFEFPTMITKPSTAAMITKPTTAPMITKPTTAPMITKPTTAPMITKPTTAPMITKPTTAPMITKPTTAPMITKPSTATMITKPTTAPMITKPSTVPMITKPTSAPMITKPTTIPMITKPTTAPMITKPSTAPMITKPTSAPMITKPTTIPMITKPTSAPMITKPTTAPMITKPSTVPMITKPTSAPMITKPTTVPVITKPTTAPKLATATDSPQPGTAFKSTTHPKTSLTRGLREQRFF